MEGLPLVFLAEEEGATSVEYALIVSFIAAVIISVVLGLGTKVQSLYQAAVKMFP
jgi:Flp pilus assembly pilin Flp